MSRAQTDRLVETKENLGGFAVVDVRDDAQARYWAGKLEVAVDWPQDHHRGHTALGGKSPADVATTLRGQNS